MIAFLPIFDFISGPAKLENSCAILRDPQGKNFWERQPLATVAVTTGFADQSHLTRHFQRLVGTTPGRFLS